MEVTSLHYFNENGNEADMGKMTFLISWQQFSQNSAKFLLPKIGCFCEKNTFRKKYTVSFNFFAEFFLAFLLMYAEDYWKYLKQNFFPIPEINLQVLNFRKKWWHYQGKDVP